MGDQQGNLKELVDYISEAIKNDDSLLDVEVASRQIIRDLNIKSILNDPQESLKEIYYKFFDQMEEPEKSEAKANLEPVISSTEIPTTIQEAIGFAFNWSDSPKKIDYWREIYLKYSQNIHT